MKIVMNISRAVVAGLALAAAAPVQAAIQVNTGSYIVAQGSSIITTVTVSDTAAPEVSAIEGMVFTYQVGAGTGTTPSIGTVDLLSNTVWTGKASSVFTPLGGNAAQYKSRDVLTDDIGEVISANGTLARVTISAGTAPLGTYPLLMTGTRTEGRDSAFVTGLGDIVPATFTGGTLTVAVNGDATLDGKVDAFDLNALAANWQAAAGTSWAKGDFNNDGKVDAFDLNALAANWQYGVAGSLEAALTFEAAFAAAFPPATVPEPGSLALLAPVAAALIRRPRRHA